MDPKSTKPATAALVFSFEQIRPEGTTIVFDENFRDLFAEGEKKEAKTLEPFWDQKVRGELQVHKVGSKVYAKGELKAAAHGECNRCLENIDLPLTTQFEIVLVATDPATIERESEDLNYGSFDGQRVDLRPYIREAVVLEYPIRFVCPDSDPKCEATAEIVQKKLAQENQAFEKELEKSPPKGSLAAGLSKRMAAQEALSSSKSAK